MALPLSPRQARSIQREAKGAVRSYSSRSSARVARAIGAALALVVLLGTQIAFAPTLAAAPLAPHAAQTLQAAHGAATTTTRQQARQSAGGQVTMIVLDMSGSMSVNDPDGLRCSAASAYISLSGVNDYIGVIGLDNHDGSRGGPHNFQRAEVWAQPTDMATLAARTHLQATIASDSNNCVPDANTPTYDALNQALSMLTAATAGNGRTGSVILLTDGVPDPDTTDQLNAIQSELLPKFQAAQFPIDTIALGADQSSHPFLQNLSTATSGNFYDDSQGPVSGAPDALNIAPFFVDIFALRNHRLLGPTVSPTTLNGGTDAQDLTVPSYVKHLDVIVVKDQAATQVTLTAPSGQVVPPAVAGVFVANDPHYAIFSIDGGALGVAAGAWTVGVTGSGRYLVDSLFQSTLALGITQPTSNVTALPLGQPFPITAELTSNGSVVVGSQYTIAGTLTSTGSTANGAPYTVGLSFSQISPGVYQVMVNVPLSAPTGTYRISISVTQVSGIPISGVDLNIRLELFPTPFLLSGRPPAPTASPVNSTVTAWDPGLQFIYSVPGLSLLSGWPLGALPARPSADLNGEVTSRNQLYPNATVIGVATRDGTNKSVAVQIINDASGHFKVIFPAPVSGDYTITFHTRGVFSDTHGDFGVTTRQVHLVVQPATIQQEVIAWLITLGAYPLIAWLIYFIFLGRPLTPGPRGSWQREPVDPQGSEGSGRFERARSRSFLRWFFHRDWRTSREAFGDNPGAILVFGRNTIMARSDGRGASAWRLENGDPLPRRPTQTNGLRNDLNRYTFSMDTSGARRGGGAVAPASSWGDAPSASSWGGAPVSSNARSARNTRNPRRGGTDSSSDTTSWG
ncbi:MAG TPA: vWA domain-containing protein [Ktedonobacterales bacterium]|nr:vWA domain-containing protein [Ktedonobacterales bacterium]